MRHSGPSGMWLCTYYRSHHGDEVVLSDNLLHQQSGPRYSVTRSDANWMSTQCGMHTDFKMDNVYFERMPLTFPKGHSLDLTWASIVDPGRLLPPGVLLRPIFVCWSFWWCNYSSIKANQCQRSTTHNWVISAASLIHPYLSGGLHATTLIGCPRPCTLHPFPLQHLPMHRIPLVQHWMGCFL